MKPNFNKKYTIEDKMRHNPHRDLTGDYFYDNIGRFCNKDAINMLHSYGDNN